MGWGEGALTHGVGRARSDFGCAARLPPDRLLAARTGTPAYYAPEVRAGPPPGARGPDAFLPPVYDGAAADVWAAGASLVALVVDGVAPGAGMSSDDSGAAAAADAATDWVAAAADRACETLPGPLAAFLHAVLEPDARARCTASGAVARLEALSLQCGAW